MIASPWRKLNGRARLVRRIWLLLWRWCCRIPNGERLNNGYNWKIRKDNFKKLRQNVRRHDPVGIRLGRLLVFRTLRLAFGHLAGQ